MLVEDAQLLWSRGQSPLSTVATVEMPKTFEKVLLFATLHLLVNAVLDKEEKVELYS